MKRIALLLLILPCHAETPADPATLGPKIVAEASAKLLAELTAAIAKDGPQGAIAVCSEKAPQIAAETGKTHGVTLRRASMKPRNPKNAADPSERESLAGFATAIEAKQAPQPRVIAAANGGKTFHAPILLASPLCLQCHGDPERDIAPATREAISRLYPKDEATGFTVGQLRGLWSVTFPEPE
jgi:hypothetical protein